MTPPMVRQMRHDVWATERLIAHCRTLTADQLELAAPGTYGSIRKTLAHIVASGEGYLVRLHGALLHDPPFRYPTSEDASLEEIAAHLPHLRDGVERLFASGEFDPDRLIRDTPLRKPTDPRFEMNAWAPLTQFSHHGSDHRAHIGTILGAHGLATPELDVWAYAQELGAERQADG